MFAYIVYILLWLPLHIIYPLRVIGRKHILKKGRMIFSANHQTVNDAIMTYFYIPRRFKYMGKASLFQNPVLGWLLKHLGVYPVHQEQSDIASVKKTLKYLKEEKAVCIFPEGKRVESNENNQIRNGVVMFSLKAKAPIVPAIFVKKTLAFRPNTLLIGEPLELYNMEEFSNCKVDKEILGRASEYLKNAIYSLKKEYLQKKKDKQFAKYQDKIIVLEKKKAKIYTFSKKRKRIAQLDKQIAVLKNKQQLAVAKIK